MHWTTLGCSGAALSHSIMKAAAFLLLQPLLELKHLQSLPGWKVSSRKGVLLGNNRGVFKAEGLGGVSIFKCLFFYCKTKDISVFRN